MYVSIISGPDKMKFPLLTYSITLIYFIVSGEINVYLVKIKVVSITSEMILYHFTIVTDTIYIFTPHDFGFLHCFRSGCYLHFRILNTSNFFVS